MNVFWIANSLWNVDRLDRMSSSHISTYSHKRIDHMEKGKEKDSMEKGHGPVPPLVEGEKPVNPFVWNLMIIFG